MFYSYDLLCAHKSGKYALLWSLANNMKKISLQKILEADLFTSCDQIITSIMSPVTGVSSPSEKLSLRLAAYLMYGACIVQDRKCSECVRYFENQINLLTSLDIEGHYATKTLLPLREARDMAVRTGKLDRNVTVEAMDTFNETLDIPRLDLQSHLSLPNISMTQEQAMIEHIDREFDATSSSHQDLRQMEKIEKEASMQIEFPQELEIPLAEDVQEDIEPKIMYVVPEVEKSVDRETISTVGQIKDYNQKVPQQLLIESSTSDDHSKLSVEQPVNNIILIPASDVTETSEEYNSPEQVVLPPMGGRRRRPANFQHDRVTQMRVIRQNDDLETRCKDFAEDMIVISAVPHLHLLINSWILDGLIQSTPIPLTRASIIQKIDTSSLRRGISDPLTESLIRHPEESHQSTLQGSILQADVGKTKSSTAPPKISLEVLHVSPTTLPEIGPEIPLGPQLLSPTVLNVLPELEVEQTENFLEPQAISYVYGPEDLMETEDPARPVNDEYVSVAERSFNEKNALEMLKQRILNLWENFDLVTFEMLCPKATTNKKNIVRTLRLLGILDSTEFLYLNQASPKDQIIISKFDFELSTDSGSNESS